MRFAPAIVLIALTQSAIAAEHPIEMTVPCQQNRSNGKITIDGSFVPDDARYRVARYNPEKAGDPWTSGKCLIVVTKGASD